MHKFCTYKKYLWVNMKRRYCMTSVSKVYAWILALAFLSQACGISQQAAAAEAKGLPASPSPTSSPTPTLVIRPTTTPSVEVVSSPTAPSVTITAVEGDIAIRLGPDSSFDATTSLKNGETAVVLARSIMNGWGQIEVPSQSGETGWVWVETGYSIINGSLFDLPRIDKVEWNVGSYLINCTPHQMIVKPGDVTLDPAGEADSRVWFAPGTYMDVTGQPVAANLTLTEHREFHILKDGTRKQWLCQ
jgi:hypothetical protein